MTLRVGIGRVENRAFEESVVHDLGVLDRNPVDRSCHTNRINITSREDRRSLLFTACDASADRGTLKLLRQIGAGVPSKALFRNIGS
jgi:hypothetical protein